MGRVLLAWAPPEQVDEVLNRRPLAAVTPNTVTDPPALCDALRQVREQGWSIVSEELEKGLLSASAPVRDRSGAVVAALASSTSIGRSGVEQLRDEVIPLLVETADRISEALRAG
jgi:IclR family pca regulon transcriptional regulator